MPSAKIDVHVAILTWTKHCACRLYTGNPHTIYVASTRGKICSSTQLDHYVHYMCTLCRHIWCESCSWRSAPIWGLIKRCVFADIDQAQRQANYGFVISQLPEFIATHPLIHCHTNVALSANYPYLLIQANCNI